MDDDPLLPSDLAPVRAPTTLFEQIERLSEERRHLLQLLPTLPRESDRRRRLAEIDRELAELWQARRRELRRPSAPADDAAAP